MGGNNNDAEKSLRKQIKRTQDELKGTSDYNKRARLSRALSDYARAAKANGFYVSDLLK